MVHRVFFFVYRFHFLKADCLWKRGAEILELIRSLGVSCDSDIKRSRVSLFQIGAVSIERLPEERGYKCAGIHNKAARARGARRG